MKNEFIINYCNLNYPDETKLIARSMINYYHIRNKEDKSDVDTAMQNRIYSGVIALFREMSKTLSNELEYNENEIFESLFMIHIKT